MDTETLQLLRRLEQGTVRTLMQREGWVTVGPFVATFHPSSEMGFMNYAIPMRDHLEPGEVKREVRRLREMFGERKRRLRFEFFEPVHMSLGAVLEEIGLLVERKAPVMVCRPGELVEHRAEGVEVSGLAGDATDGVLRQLLAASQRGFGYGNGDVSVSEVAEQRGHLAAGRYRSAYALIDGVVAGIGSVTVGNDELVGIATVPEHRRRGVAAAVSSFLVKEHFDRGGPLAWLTAGDDAAEAVYRKIGFRRAAWQMNYVDR